MNSFQRVALTVMGVVLGASVGGIPYLKQINAIEQKAQVRIEDQLIVAEVARTEKARAVGLSNREVLGINEGLLFTFDQPGIYGFWMKDMRFPIDIMWIKDNKIVGFQERVSVQPEARDSDLKIYYPPQEIDSVLEMVAGRIRLLRVGVGARVEVKAFAPRIELGEK